MESFEELNLAPEWVEALAAEGIETPTALQSAAIPVLLRGNNLVALAGPGAGVTVAVGLPLLARLEADAGAPVAIVLEPTPERAAQVAAELGRLAIGSAHRVAALDASWALPEQASVVVATPGAVRAALGASRLPLEAVQAVVVDGATVMSALPGEWDAVNALFEVLPDAAQRVVVALPMNDTVTDFVGRRLHRAVTVPAREAEGSVAERGEVKVRHVRAGDAAGTLATLAAELLADDEVRHLLVFARSEDAAADLADVLSLHGFAAGSPDELDLPVWVAVDALAARATIDAALAEERVPSGSVVIVSADVPADPDALDRRHGRGGGGWIIAEPRELPHVRDVVRRTGYKLKMVPPKPAAGASSELGMLVRAVEASLEANDVDAYQIVLEGLFSRHGAERVAAALLGMVRARPRLVEGVVAAAEAEVAAAAAPAGRAAAPVADVVKLFVSIGERDGMRPGDLVGAITGEARIPASKIGKIEIRDTFSRVEVARDVADMVIRALNGTTLRGRSVRVDLDWAERGGGGPGARGPGGPRGGGSRGGPPRGGADRRGPPRGGPGRGGPGRGGPGRGDSDRGGPPRGRPGPR